MLISRKQSVFGVLLLCLVLLASCSDSKTFTEPLPETVDFNFHVKPILVQNCYLCHGPDPSSRKADLRLDIFEGATAEREEGGHAIVPGKPSKSLLVERINHTEADIMMPPPDSNLKLSEREKALLEKWIDQGAEWKEHWAFIQPTVELPEGDVHVIDAFIEEKLSQKGLEKSAVATKNALIRRVAYLLTGLPPSSTDVQAFVEDDDQNAYEKMVDRYLNSPGYGERWARHWMDLVRYAETKGHEFDYTITGAWKYRDYLIRAFNEDISYDQLVKEHLAGDLLDKPRYDEASGLVESPLGTAFYAMGEGTHSPVDVRQDEADRIDNMIDVTSKTFQGLTVSCAKCHDHKFDPITAADYYAFYGIIESTRFSPVPADFSKSDKKTVQTVKDLKTYMRQLVSDKWSEDVAPAQEIAKTGNDKKEAAPVDYTILGDFRNADLNGWVSDGLAFGERTTLGDPLIEKSSGKLIGLEEGRASSKLFGIGIFGVLRSPNITLDSDYIGIRARGDKSTIRIIIDNFQLIQDPIYGNISQEIKSTEWNNYVFNVGPWKGHKAYIEILPGGYDRHNYKLPENAFVEAKYAIAYDSQWPTEVIQKTDDANRQKTENGTRWEQSPQLVKILNGQLKKGRLPSRFPELKSVLDSSQKLAKSLENHSFFYGVNDGFGIDSPVFNRGSYQEPSEDKVPRRFLSALPSGDTPFSSKGSGRLELAEAVLNKDNPLTSRVMVNRIWHHLFGRGIVETVDNFGLQGKLPSHPKLLDYLAVKFQNNDWSIKKMIRHIVTSETFKRSASRSDELSEKDPTNMYLASFPVRRLESEAIRDGMLIASGSLDSTLYGPPIATHLTEFMQGRGRPVKSGPLDGAGRRSIYQEVRRNFLEPMMTTFDRPIPFSTFGRRNVTNVPSQSLIIMNDPFVIDQAERMAEKLLAQENLDFGQKIDWIYLRAFSRKPTPVELAKAKTFTDAIRSMENQSPEKTEDEEPSDQDTMIWKEYCHSIFNLKEFIYLM